MVNNSDPPKEKEAKRKTEPRQQQAECFIIMSSRPLTFQARREAHAQRHGNFASLLEENEDDDIPLRTPVA